MLKDLSRARVVGSWCAATIVFGACAVVAGVDPTAGNGELLLVACLVPPAVLLLVWRGAPPITVAEVLYAVNRPATEVRP